MIMPIDDAMNAEQQQPLGGLHSPSTFGDVRLAARHMCGLELVLQPLVPAQPSQLPGAWAARGAVPALALPRHRG